MPITPNPVRRARSRSSANQALLAAAAAAALAAATPAQVQLGALPRRALPSTVGAASAVALGDVDGDGHPDFVFASNGQQNRLCINDGYGNSADVTAARMPALADYTTCLALGDVDGDGDLDVVFGNNGQQNRLYVNDGTGTFTDVSAAQMPVDGDWTTAVVLGDVDGDGDLDIVLGTLNQQNRLYLNAGTNSGVFVDVTGAQMPIDTDGTTSVCLGDVDGDGDLDLVFGNTYWPPYSSWIGEQNRLYANNGTGTFVDVTATQMPANLDLTSALTLGDVDGDGDLDLVVGNGGHAYHYCPKYGPCTWLYNGNQNGLLLNNGTGTFTPGPPLPSVFDLTSAVGMADIDGDGDLDLVFGDAGQVATLLLNDGTGAFTDATSRVQVQAGWTSGVALGDVDGDGDVDLVMAEGSFTAPSQSRLYLNLGRQFEGGVGFQVGQNYHIWAWLRYGPPSTGDLALPVMSLGTGAVPLPPFGTLRVDPLTMVPLPLISIPQPSGAGSIVLPVPNVPGLIGLHVYSQALLVPQAGPATLSNVAPDVLQ